MAFRELVFKIAYNDQKLKRISLYPSDEDPIGDQEAIELARVLGQNTALEALHFLETNIGNDGAVALARALENNRSLKKLSLYKNRIGDEGAFALARALKTNSTLESLNLEHNKRIGDAGAKALAEALSTNNTLKSLEIGGNPIGDDGAIAFASILTKNAPLQTLHLDSTEIGDKGAIALSHAIAHNMTLKDFSFTNTLMGIDGATALVMVFATNASLTKFNIANNILPAPEIMERALFQNGLRTTNLIINGVFRNREISGRIIKTVIERNKRAHARVQRVKDLILTKPYIGGVSRDMAQKLADDLWETRGDSVWWTEDEGGTFGVAQLEENIRFKRPKFTQSCIQCVVRDAAWKERESPTRIFCGNYCQMLHHFDWMPDLRGMTAEQAKRALK